MKLKQIIDEAGYEITKLAKESRVSRATIYNAINGKKIRNSCYGRLAKVLNCSISDLKE